ncbi:phosphatidate cytidylyltransferase [Couchioplanes caeruleus]|uniref:Phosphatidate cytidylyltransferase n=2 Tax=Couchioplanes caeruleus TaxID=56438 RepID=A0A1K0GMM9_9ACTN|nr:phosphatidate cytidylyltransferase [Couchioplanes caeruleus]OJF10459.1 phosphatidate cytidylyltransferase [Couchioplanes caeruleus subsp. caeruleus]ROP32535.1 phosphatidate cytidylyltransferase [Couchioplanes caeruleus]
MTYPEPRGGHPSGSRASGPSDAPLNAGHAPAERLGQDRHPVAPARPSGALRAAEPDWAAPTAATSTSQAEWELTTAEAGRRGPGKRRAGRDGKPVPAKQKGKAGRNLPAAIGVGVGLGLVILLSLVIRKEAFLGVLVVVAGVGIWETVRALKVAGARPPLVPLFAGGILMIGLAWFYGPDALQLGLLATLLATVVWRFSEHKAGFRRDLAAAALVAVYVPFLLGFGVLLAEPDDGPSRVLSALIAVILSDTGGYAAGVFFGKHPMAPTISPKKSWEGFAGSVTAAAVGSGLLLYFLLDVSFGWGLLFGAVISVAAVTGDLAESMLKRDIGVKDMSNLLPGHGGLMDRLDSILFAVPAAYLLLSLIAPPG